MPILNIVSDARSVASLVLHCHHGNHHPPLIVGARGRRAIPGALAEILDSTAGAVPCPSTGVVLTIDFNALVVSAPSPPDSDIADTTVTFNVDDLEGNPTTFEVLLDTCDFAEGDAIVASVAYADDQGNSPDMSAMEGNGVVPGCGEQGAAEAHAGVELGEGKRVTVVPPVLSTGSAVV